MHVSILCTRVFMYLSDARYLTGVDLLFVYHHVTCVCGYIVVRLLKYHTYTLKSMLNIYFTTTKECPLSCLIGI
jgi:hypothetical protein